MWLCVGARAHTLPHPSFAPTHVTPPAITSHTRRPETLQRFRLLDSGSCDFGKYLFSGVGAFALLQDRRRRPPRTRPCDGETVEDDGDSSGPIRTTQPSADDGADSLGGHGDESNATAGGGEGEGGVGRTGRRTGGALGSGAEASESGIVCVATGHLYWHPDG